MNLSFVACCSRHAFLASLFAGSLVSPVLADSFFFSTGNPDGRVATASRPGSSGQIEIESADDFALTSPISLTSATFTGLMPAGSTLGSILDVRVEFYRLFPQDSDVGRTDGAPLFSTPEVPTRVNSPSDVAFDSREAAGGLSFSASFLNSTFTANNSVVTGIHPKPGNLTGGDGAVSGQEVQFDINFTGPVSLPAGHYFFIPQVQLETGDFLWLSSPRPITPPGTPFPAGQTDLQSWIRDENLSPDWLRVGTDIVGGTTFNGAFSLTGTIIPETAPDSGSSLALAAFAIAGLTILRRCERIR